MRCRVFIGLVLLMFSSAASAQAPSLANRYPVTSYSVLGAPAAQCRRAISGAERAGVIPPHLLSAISLVESGRRDPQTGRIDPWPWTINAEGQGFFYESKAQAVAAVHALQAHGVHSIDVGCMQVNLMHHPAAFASLEQAFDPATNAAYAARFLGQLHGQTGDWAKAAAFYHSQTPGLSADYARKVLALWPLEKRNQAGSDLNDALVSAWASTLADAIPTNRVVVSLPTARTGAMRVIPIGAASRERSLDVYRASPMAIASRLQRGSGG